MPKKRTSSFMTLIQLFRDLHAVLLRDRDLKELADEEKRRLRRFEVRAEQQQKLVAEIQANLKQLKVTINDKEVTIKANQAKIAKYQEQLNKASTPKEYEALRREIENEKLANRVLEEQILQAMLEVEEKAKQIPELEKSLLVIIEEKRVALEGRADTQADLTNRLAQAKGEMDQLVSKLPGEVRELYIRLSNAHGADSFSLVQKHYCSACYTEPTAQMHNDLLSDRLVICKSCGRILYTD